MQSSEKKQLLIVVSVIITLGFIIDGVAMNMLLNFLLAGVIPGTQLSIPYWAMMTVYCLIITAVATWAIELYFIHKSTPLQSKKSTGKAKRTKASSLQQAE